MLPGILFCLIASRVLLLSKQCFLKLSSKVVGLQQLALSIPSKFLTKDLEKIGQILDGQYLLLKATLAG